MRLRIGMSSTCKRLLDIFAAGTALIVLSPVMLAIAVLLRLGSRGPVLSRQEGVILRARPSTPMPTDWRRDLERFTYYRFRTDDHRSGIRSRTSRVGRILRRTRLDELLLLWSVLIGDMSMVGPLAATPSEVEAYENWHYLRLKSKPGLTGLWQVTAIRGVDFDMAARADIWYLRHRSLWLDFKILMVTPWVAVKLSIPRRGLEKA